MEAPTFFLDVSGIITPGCGPTLKGCDYYWSGEPWNRLSMVVIREAGTSPSCSVNMQVLLGNDTWVTLTGAPGYGMGGPLAVTYLAYGPAYACASLGPFRQARWWVQSTGGNTLRIQMLAGR